MRYSIATILTVALVATLGLSAFLANARLRRISDEATMLRQEVANLRMKLGYSLIDDSKQFYVTEIENDQYAKWAWRVFIPDGKQCTLKSEIFGRAQPDGELKTIVKNISVDGPHDFVFFLNAIEQPEGGLAYTGRFDNGDAILLATDLHGSHASILNGQARLFRTTSFDDKFKQLLDFRIYENGTPGDCGVTINLTSDE